ncbi:hypothetical protein CCICO_00550 [Corynebacterium ciconiae DSM 44920]|uniref:choice-of-anchor M domain-containing protein n=1 Tax=Corynebacterium ciconiae TaxID=227319 RepID=UPI00036BC0E1|nr:choice-of-anchor M domain-containing protein [Corynebacterium ciconiae]WKD60170.1 hypothetical protein CCICO_00550 [Corynebacterium ciconiae DSM 44920]
MRDRHQAHRHRQHPGAVLVASLLCLSLLSGLLMGLPGSAPSATADTAPAAATAMHEGHADFGPVIADGQFALQIRDDTVSPPEWRNPDELVFVLDQSSAQQLPEGDEFAFTGAEPGQSVWVIPQTQKPEVPWLGWNTQSPTLEGVVDGGVTFTYEGHQGPGDFSLFLQDGGLNGPEQVFVNAGDTAFVDLGTHTHANWVFTEPGVHLVKLNVNAGEQTAEAVLRFVVSDSSASEEEITAAASEEWTGPTEETSSGVDGLLLLGIGLFVVAVLIVGAAVWLRRR